MYRIDEIDEIINQCKSLSLTNLRCILAIAETLKFNQNTTMPLKYNNDCNKQKKDNK